MLSTQSTFIRSFSKTWPLYQFRNLNSVPLSFIKAENKKTDSNKAPLLIFHGLFGSKTNWKSISHNLANRTNRIIYSFDLRNHGDSPHVNGDQSSLNEMAGDILLFIENNNLDKAVLLGHSLGGRVVSQFAFNWPDKVDKLILADISPLPKLPDASFLADDFFDLTKNSVHDIPSGIDLSKARKEVGKKLMTILKDKFVVDFFLLSLYKDKDGSFKWRFNVDALKILKNKYISNINVKQPFKGDSVIIYGGNSNYVREQDLDEIRQLLPSVKFISIPGAGHYLHIEKTTEFIDHVVKFLQ